ncbi:hypothetical protein GCM10028895_34080 [Pontibacter rugosus]
MRPNPLIPEEKSLQAELQGNTFRIEVPLQGAMVAELLHGNELVPVYLEPGYELSLSFNGDKFLRTLKYTGKGGNENNYLATYTTRFEDEEDYQVLPDNIKLKEEEFTAFLDYRRNDQLKSLDKYAGKNPVSDTFRNFLLAEVEFSYAKDKLRYHPLRQQILQVALTKPSPAFYTYLDKLDMQRPANLVSPAFVRFLQEYGIHYAQEAGYTEKDATYYKVAYSTVSQKLQGQAKLLAQAHILKQSIKSGHLQYTEQMLQDFTTTNKDAAVNAYLQQQHDANKAFAIGSEAPDFKYKNLAGDTVSLSSFKGQLVYLSFWRSDCSLCYVEQPHLEQLAVKFKGQKIVFLNVFISDNEQKWRKSAQGKDLQGEQAFVSITQQEELIANYKLEDMPAYFLVDAEGRFISQKARHPNDREAANDLAGHLQTRQASAK